MKSIINRPAVKRVIITLHRDLGYFFTGIILIYALSGILMNHRDSFNPNYSVEIIESVLPDEFPSDREFVTDADIKSLAASAGQEDRLVKHFYTKGNMKLLFKGGSSMVANLQDRTITYEKVSRRLILSDMVRLHYNPGSWWTWFSDIFAVVLIIITVTGLMIVKGRFGFWWRGVLLMLLGLIMPLIFLLQG